MSPAKCPWRRPGPSSCPTPAGRPGAGTSPPARERPARRPSARRAPACGHRPHPAWSLHSFGRFRTPPIHAGSGFAAKLAEAAGNGAGARRESYRVHPVLHCARNSCASRSTAAMLFFFGRGRLARPMQLPKDIPTLGGITPDPPPSRRAELEQRGEQAQSQVAALLSRARSRAVRLAGLRGLSVLLAGLQISLLSGAMLAAVNGAWLARGVAIALSLLSAAAVVFFSLRSPLQRAAIRARDPRDLARLLGGPSELLSSVELSRDPPRGASLELLSLLHVRAAESAKKIDVSVALPASSLRWPFAALLAGGALFFVAAALAPRHVSQGLRRLWKGDAGAPPLELSPIAGDLSITYLYPVYTGLPPRTEEGTAGDLRAPKGTEVRLSARADRDLDQAFAVVTVGVTSPPPDDRAEAGGRSIGGAAVHLDAQGQGHRQLSGGFTLSQQGQWSLRFADQRGRTIAEGSPRPIEIIADAAPQVAIDAPTQKVLEVDPQGKVSLSWSATDDYGLSRIELVWQLAGGKEERAVLNVPAAPAKRLRGTYVWEMAGLHLRAGDKVSYHLEAKDNDAVDGPQRGVSASQALKVF